ncbi:MAG: EscU/YscU/HrcU family type III secretion system export apparatus switch protein [Tatlockia sp.]|nr:EscU/YscU/HrcU family type III secretion system export apparatus switch protein [Tatlockia sp.]
MSSKTEKATPYKLQKAKEKGQVSKSSDLNTSVFLILMVIVGMALWPSLLQQLKTLITYILYLASRFALSVDNVVKIEHFLLSNLLNLWLPFALAAVLVLNITTIAQTGFIWSMHPLTPDFKRINPVQGFKRIFSSQLFFDAFKNSLKLILVFSVSMFSLHQEIPAFLNLMVINPLQHPAYIMQFFIKIILELLLLLFGLSILDKMYSSWKFKKDNRMSKQEVKDEYRQRDGDPTIKAKIRSLQQQLRQKTQSLAQVKYADVIVTNPTHLAIALKYERSSMPAPKVVCKAQGDQEVQVRALAKRHNIPIIENKSFAKALFATVELNRWISNEHFPVAASIFREIYRQREHAYV